MNWFEIDKAGLAKILARKGKEFILFELIQNAWDEPGVTEVNVTLVPDATPGYAYLIVQDDAPDGFADLTHAYTLFAESTKKNNPEQRGRFNMGEKLALALAREAKISTTTGTVNFNGKGRRRSSERREKGSQVEMSIKMTRAEIESAISACRKLIPPTGEKTIITVINKNALSSCPPHIQFEATLQTEIGDADGHLVRSARKTVVRVYDAVPEEGCPAAIYEMGIPVCEIDGSYIFDVGQKVPLTMDREEVLPSFRKQLAVAAVNNLMDNLSSDDANTTWATDATTSPDITPDALNAVMDKKFGEKRVIYDPSDPEANARASAEGYTVITGGQLSAATWENIRSYGTALPAGKVTPSPKPYSPDGDPLPRVKELTHGMREFEAYAKKFAEKILGVYHLEVIFAVKATWPYGATYGPGGPLTVNVGTLGYAWFDARADKMKNWDDLIIHEFGHEYEGNHLSEDYYKALTKIGSKLAQAIRAGRM